MTESLMINSLSSLMVIISLLVIVVRSTTCSLALYALQSLALVVIFLLLGSMLGIGQLYAWAGSAFVTKVLLSSGIMYWGFTHLKDPKAEGSLLHPAVVWLFAALIIVLCYFVLKPVNMDLISHGNVQIGALKPVLAVSLAQFMIGVLCVVIQRNILKQVFGYCLMDNGSHLTLAVLANQAPELVEVGIATDAIFAVAVMTYLVRRIYNTIHTLDANELTALKG